MSEIIGNSPGSTAGGEDKVPAALRKHRLETFRSGAASADAAPPVPRRGGFEQVLGEELGSVKRMGGGPASASESPVENLLISRNLGALYRSFLNLDE